MRADDERVSDGAIAEYDEVQRGGEQDHFQQVRFFPGQEPQSGLEVVEWRRHLLVAFGHTKPDEAFDGRRAGECRHGDGHHRPDAEERVHGASEEAGYQCADLLHLTDYRGAGVQRRIPVLAQHLRQRGFDGRRLEDTEQR